MSQDGDEFGSRYEELFRPQEEVYVKLEPQESTYGEVDKINGYIWDGDGYTLVTEAGFKDEY